MTERDLEEAEQNVKRLHSELRTAVKHRNAVRAAMKDRCVIICDHGWQCSFTVQRGQRICEVHRRLERLRASKACLTPGERLFGRLEGKR